MTQTERRIFFSDMEVIFHVIRDADYPIYRKLLRKNQ